MNKDRKHNFEIENNECDTVVERSLAPGVVQELPDNALMAVPGGADDALMSVYNENKVDPALKALSTALDGGDSGKRQRRERYRTNQEHKRRRMRD